MIYGAAGQYVRDHFPGRERCYYARGVGSEMEASSSHAHKCMRTVLYEHQVDVHNSPDDIPSWTCRFEARAAELRPPATSEELEFREWLPKTGRKAWDFTRLTLDQYLPCRSEYLLAEQQHDSFYCSPVDIICMLTALGFTPLYFTYFKLTVECFGTFLLFRVLIPSMLACIRLYRPLRGKQLSLFAADAALAFLLCGGLYLEVGVIIRICNFAFFDTQLQRMEEEMFGCQPATEFSRVFDYKVIGEYLHWCYFSFYVILVLPLATLWWRYPRESFITLATAQLLAMTSCSFTWIYYPAKGPYWTLDPRPAEQVGYFMSYIVQFFVEGGSSLGTACPSSHCAVTSVVFLTTVWETGHFHIPFMLIVPGLWLATVYGGFHYVIDSFIGIGLGVFSSVIAKVFTQLWIAKFQHLAEVEGSIQILPPTHDRI